MLAQIIIHTPLWVWGLLLALLALGLNQMFTRTVTLRRTTLLPLIMFGLSLNGTISAFGTAPQVLLVWLVAGLLAGALVLQLRLPQGTRFDTASRRFTVPGSAVPLVLIVGIFLVKYGVGATLAVQPALAHSADFRLVFGTLYGAFSGVFAARGLRLWRLALQQERASQGGVSSAPSLTR